MMCVKAPPHILPPPPHTNKEGASNLLYSQSVKNAHLGEEGEEGQVGTAGLADHPHLVRVPAVEHDLAQRPADPAVDVLQHLQSGPLGTRSPAAFPRVDMEEAGRREGGREEKASVGSMIN